MHLPAVLTRKISIDVGVADFLSVNAAVMPEYVYPVPVPALRDFVFIAWRPF